MTWPLVSKAVHEDLRQKSYVMRRQQFLSKTIRNNHLTRVKTSWASWSIWRSQERCVFFCDEENFVQLQRVNSKNIDGCVNSHGDVPTIMHRKFLASMVILGVVWSEGDLCASMFLYLRCQSQCLCLYRGIETLHDFCSTWKTVYVSTRIRIIPYCPYSPKMDGWKFSWPCHPELAAPSSPDVKPLDYYSIMHGAWLRGTPIGIHTTLLRFSGYPLYMHWQAIPTPISLLLADDFQSMQKLLLRLTVVSVNDVIHWVCGTCTERSNVKNVLSLMSVPVWIQTWFCSQMHAAICM